MAKVAVAAILFGWAAFLFSELAHSAGKIFKRAVPSPVLRPVAGAALIIGLVFLTGTRDYLGIGVSSDDPGTVTILSCFHQGGALSWSWGWKGLFTAVTLGSGFKGGEVTPLFFIGAALGNTLSWLMDAPVELFAALGLVAVFAGASNTPLACTIMAMELFGTSNIVYYAVACFLSYFFSGHNDIYLSQHVGISKIPASGLHPETSLRSIREGTPTFLERVRALLKRK